MLTREERVGFEPMKCFLLNNFDVLALDHSATFSNEILQEIRFLEGMFNLFEEQKINVA